MDKIVYAFGCLESFLPGKYNGSEINLRKIKTYQYSRLTKLQFLVTKLYKVLGVLNKIVPSL